MKINGDHLSRHLNKDLAGAYLVSGDEPLLVMEAADSIREAAARRGFQHRDLNIVERGFQWIELEAAAENLSLFSSRRILELRLPTPKPGVLGGRSIRALAERPNPDRLLLVVTSKLGEAAKSAWVKAIEANGVLVQVWPVERRHLVSWIRDRAARSKLELTGDAAEFLADKVEGNLLAADQELIKLALVRGEGRLSVEVVAESVAMNARFDVFSLTDALIGGRTRRAFEVLDGLKTEGVTPVLISWALIRELTRLARMKVTLRQGGDLNQIFNKFKVWRQRQPIIKRALESHSEESLTVLLHQAAEVDRIIKGVDVDKGRPWDALTQLVLAFFEASRHKTQPLV